MRCSELDKKLYTQINDHLWIFNNKNESLLVLIRRKTFDDTGYYFEFGEIKFKAPVLTDYKAYRVMLHKPWDELHETDQKVIFRANVYNSVTLPDEQAVFDMFDQDIRYLSNIKTQADVAAAYKYNNITSNANYRQSRLGSDILFYNYKDYALILMIRKTLPSGENYYELCQFIADPIVNISSVIRFRIYTCQDLPEQDREFLLRLYDFRHTEFSTEYCRKEDADEAMNIAFHRWIMDHVTFLLDEFNSIG